MGEGATRTTGVGAASVGATTAAMGVVASAATAATAGSVAAGGMSGGATAAGESGPKAVGATEGDAAAVSCAFATPALATASVVVIFGGCGATVGGASWRVVAHPARTRATQATSTREGRRPQYMQSQYALPGRAAWGLFPQSAVSGFVHGPRSWAWPSWEAAGCAPGWIAGSALHVAQARN